MTETSHPGGLGRLGQHTVARIGYGAMQLGDQISDDDAVALLQRTAALGVNHAFDQGIACGIKPGQLIDAATVVRNRNVESSTAH